MWIDEHMENYFNWIKEKTNVFRGANSEWLTIETPVLGLFNDNVTVYAHRQESSIILSDDGETIRNLELSGVNVFSSLNRKDILRKILLNYGIREEDGELKVLTSAEKFPQAKHNLISAISEVWGEFTNKLARD